MVQTLRIKLVLFVHLYRYQSGTRKVEQAPNWNKESNQNHFEGGTRGTRALRVVPHTPLSKTLIHQGSKPLKEQAEQVEQQYIKIGK
jgi:hypothetical protein